MKQLARQSFFGEISSRPEFSKTRSELFFRVNQMIMDNEKVKKLYTARASLYHFLFLDLLGGHKKVKNILQRSDYVRSDFKILDAGCGTGNMTRALYEISFDNDYKNVVFHAFDLTQAMLDLFRQWIDKVGTRNIVLRQADVLHLEQLPADWSGYDRIVSSAMLEYLPRNKMREAVRGLKALLKPDGKLLIIITKSNIVTRWFIGLWWKANLYNEQELRDIFCDMGFSKFKIVKSWWSSMVAIEAEN